MSKAEALQVISIFSILGIAGSDFGTVRVSVQILDSDSYSQLLWMERTLRTLSFFVILHCKFTFSEKSPFHAMLATFGVLSNPGLLRPFRNLIAPILFAMSGGWMTVSKPNVLFARHIPSAVLCIGSADSSA